MPKFRRRPDVTDAVQFNGVEPFPPGVCVNGHIPNGPRFDKPHVHTAHGYHVTLAIGDWVLPEPNQQGYYPVKPDIFHATYEPVTGKENA